MIELREWTPEDTVVLLGWIEEWPEFMEYVGQTDKAEMVDTITKGMFAPNAAILAAMEDGELMGYLAAMNAQPDGSAMVQFGLPKEHRGRGKDLMRVGLEYAFERLGLQTLIAAVPLTKRGRVIERFDRRFGFKGHNVKILTLSKSDWESQNGR